MKTTGICSLLTAALILVSCGTNGAAPGLSGSESRKASNAAAVAAGPDPAAGNDPEVAEGSPSSVRTSNTRRASSTGSTNAAASGQIKHPAPAPKTTTAAPPSTGCSTWEAGVIVAGTGGGYSCSYSASNPGGYSASGTGGWRVRIRRGETTIEANGNRDPFCAATGFIRPGDEVTAWADPVGYNRIAVGDDVRC